LRERNAPLLMFNPARFPHDAALSLAFSPSGHYTPVLRIDGESIDLTNVSAIWYRRPQKPVAHAELPVRAVRGYVELECDMVVRDMWASLDCDWLPAPPWVVQYTEHKTFQLKVAGELGFELPPTLTTNHPSDLIEFYRQHDGRIISKQAAKALQLALGDSLIRYTELVTTRDIAHARAISYCPMTFQSYVPKRVELRITVVGRRVFAAEIHSQATNHTRIDWRRYDQGRTPHCRHDLPSDIEYRCVRLVERLGLRYGAIDMVLTPDGRYVFIEINPNGQYLWIEDETGLPISDAICDLLLSGHHDSASTQLEVRP
ncbi:MAG TPA: hypothetical protein VK427_02890, partial [Kofleriaceae bacterium]|nr:hypothetical protein [Kofleriaceae bacterium]